MKSLDFKSLQMKDIVEYVSQLPKIREKTPEQQIEIDNHVDAIVKKYTAQPKIQKRQIGQFPEIRRKTIAHVEVDDWDGHQAMSVKITFKDHSVLQIDGEVGYEFNHPFYVTYKL